jgi:hypothetical protein
LHERWCVTQTRSTAGGFFAVKSTSRVCLLGAKSSLQFELAVVTGSGPQWLSATKDRSMAAQDVDAACSSPGEQGVVAYPGEQISN